MMSHVNIHNQNDNLKLGDLVVMQSSKSHHDSTVEEMGFIFDREGDELQILRVTRMRPKDQNHSICIQTENLEVKKGSEIYYIKTNKMMLVPLQSVVRKMNRVRIEKIDEILRRISHQIAEKHYTAIHLGQKNFVPGETYIPYSGRCYDAEEIKALVDASFDFWLTTGRFTRQFEKAFAHFLNVKYSLLTNSGSSANLLAISALTSLKLGKRCLKPGDEVITTACAFPTTVNPIVQNRMIPVFLDVDIGTYNIQSEKIEAALSDRTKAIFLAHTLGNPFTVDTVMRVAEKYNLWVIEDNCDALGSKYHDQYTGTFGHIGTFSFYPPHHITMGEGGAIVTNDNQLKRLISSFRDWGRDCWCESGVDNTCKKRFNWQLGDLPFGYDHKYIYSHIGYNLKVTDMQAAIGVAQLNKLSNFIEARKRNWKTLYDGLKKYESYFILPHKEEYSDPSWFGFLLTVKEDAPFSKIDIVNYLEKNKIATRMLFSGNIIRQPSFQNIQFRIFDNLKNTDFIMQNTFWIGVYPGMTQSMLDYMISKIEQFIKYKGG